MRWSGVRINEALTIYWSDVNDKRILIRQGKGDTQREIPLAPFPALRETLKALETLRGGKEGKLFTWTAYAILQLWLRDALVELGIPAGGRSFHSIRKWFENHLLNQMMLPAHITAQILGHTVAIQQKHYLKKLNADELEQTIQNYSENGAKKT